VPVEIGTRVRSVIAAQIAAGVREGTMHPIAPDQFVANLLASVCSRLPRGRC
jgi:hypothetical protein